MDLNKNLNNNQNNNQNSEKTKTMFIVLLLFLIMLIAICYYILSNEIAYKEYATSNEVRKTEVEVIDIRTSNLLSNGKTARVIGTKYNYTVKFTVDNVEYQSKLIEKIYFSSSKKSMEIGDKTIAEIYKDKKGNYKIPKFKSLEEKNNENKFFITFVICSGSIYVVFIFALILFLRSQKQKND